MQIERSIVAPKPAARVWQALTDRGEFGQWFNVEVTAGRFAAGERVDMLCTTPGYEGVAFYFVIGEMTAERRFSWRWHPGLEKPGDDFSSEPMTEVVFELEAAEGGTLVRLLETGFDLLPAERRDKTYKENEGGWEYMLGSLVRHL